MIRLIYNLLFPVAILVFLPGYLLKMFRRGQYAPNFGQRFGIYRSDVRARLSSVQPIWMHAVSVGEVTVALKLADEMKRGDPSLAVALTTTTVTGFALAAKEPRDWLHVLYSPLDFWPIVRRAFDAIRPLALILVEAEVWPNQTAEAGARAVPIALVNARLSPRSERRFRRFRWFVKPVFRRLDLVCVQEAADVEKWRGLGISTERIQHVGSMKFDVPTSPVSNWEPQDFLAGLGITADRPVLLAGSTHPGEEEIVARVFRRLRQDFPHLFLVVAPRHVERSRRITADLEGLGLRVTRRSEGAKPIEVDCLVLDTTGELRDWYAVATVVFVGKSLTVAGGQNPAEPIVAGVPVIFGPLMENFAALAHSLVAADGAVQVDNVLTLDTAVADLLRDQRRRAALVANGRRALSAHHGATARTVALLKQLRRSAGSKLPCKPETSF